MEQGGLKEQCNSATQKIESNESQKSNPTLQNANKEVKQNPIICAGNDNLPFTNAKWSKVTPQKKT